MTADGAQLRVVDEGAHAAAEGVGGQDAVGVGEGDDVTVGDLARLHQRVLLTEVLLQVEHGDSELGLQSAQHVTGAVLGHVVHDDDLKKVLVVLAQGHRAHAGFDVIDLVLDREQEADLGPRRQDREVCQLLLLGALAQGPLRRVVVAAVRDVEHGDRAGQHGEAVAEHQRALGQAWCLTGQDQQQRQQAEQGQYTADAVTERRVHRVQPTAQEARFDLPGRAQLRQRRWCGALCLRAVERDRGVAGTEERVRAFRIELPVRGDGSTSGSGPDMVTRPPCAQARRGGRWRPAPAVEPAASRGPCRAGRCAPGPGPRALPRGRGCSAECAHRSAAKV